MSSCEKCWTDSRYADEYRRLLKEREEHPCSPEEQAGPDAGECPVCGRKTLHQFTGEPMCGCAIEPTCSECGHSYAQHTKGPAQSQFCRHCPCIAFKPSLHSGENNG